MIFDWLEHNHTIIAYIFLFIGGFLHLTSAVGALRMPNFFTRLHAAGVGETGGVSMIVLGIIIMKGFSIITLKIMLLWLFMIVTNPTATHALAKSALLSGVVGTSNRKE